MKRTGSTLRQNPRGSTLLLSLICIALFSALAAALGTVAGSNIRIADNYRRADTSRCSAESGLEVMRYWLSQVVLTGVPEERFNELEATRHSQTGTFLLAPGFKASFGGSFGTLAGAIAANGLCFYGNAGGTVEGSIINYNSEIPWR